MNGIVPKYDYKTNIQPLQVNLGELILHNNKQQKHYCTAGTYMHVITYNKAKYTVATKLLTANQTLQCTAEHKDNLDNRALKYRHNKWHNVPLPSSSTSSQTLMIYIHPKSIDFKRFMPFSTYKCCCLNLWSKKLISTHIGCISRSFGSLYLEKNMYH